MWDLVKQFGAGGIIGAIVAGVACASLLSGDQTEILGAGAIGAIVGFSVQKFRPRPRP